MKKNPIEYSYITQADLELVIPLLKSPQASEIHLRYIFNDICKYFM